VSAAGDAERLFEEAPCAYVVTDPDGRLLRVNRTFERWTGRPRESLVGVARFADLLTGGGRIYHETHFAPLLRMQGWVRTIALDIVRADGTRMPGLVSSVVVDGPDGRPATINTTIADATDRRGYEDELRRARDRERTIAQHLQHGLLEGALHDPRVSIGVTYLPSTVGLEVGGDWYDSFAIDDDRVALVIGDVVGHGIDAAATMGQLRTAIRALAITGLPPAAVLEALDRYAERHDAGVMATIAYAELDARTGALRLSFAGHMPGVLLEPDRPARHLEGGRSVPLAVHSEPFARPEMEVRLTPGSTLVLYTDGLVERADRPLDDGMDRLLGHLDAERATTTTALAARLADAMLPGGPNRDDVCVLAARWTPASTL
jgi:sigma-B regulation protein RsbU (phosphoserine phosphatase)